MKKLLIIFVILTLVILTFGPMNGYIRLYKSIQTLMDESSADFQLNLEMDLNSCFQLKHRLPEMKAQVSGTLQESTLYGDMTITTFGLENHTLGFYLDDQILKVHVKNFLDLGMHFYLADYFQDTSGFLLDKPGLGDFKIKREQSKDLEIFELNFEKTYIIEELEVIQQALTLDISPAIKSIESGPKYPLALTFILSKDQLIQVDMTMMHVNDNLLNLHLELLPQAHTRDVSNYNVTTMDSKLFMRLLEE